MRSRGNAPSEAEAEVEDAAREAESSHGVHAVGIVFVAIGLRRSFEKRVSVPDGRLGVTIKALGVVGFVAKGIALVVLAILVIVAAAKVDPKATGGLDAAIDALVERPYGPLLVGAVGIGLVAYGEFCFFRARYAKLSEP